jgi:uncharacterized protein (TIGR03437 family)
MKAARLLLCLFSACAGILYAQTPAITGVLNGASLDTRLAPGVVANVFGTNFGTSTSIAVTVAGKQAKVLFATGGQLSIQIPVDAPTGATTLQVGTSAPFNITLTQYAPALFTTGNTGSGLVAAIHGQGSGTITESSPAKPGETVSIYATGLGATTPVVATGTPTPVSPQTNTNVKPTVTVGGLPATVIASILAPSQVGLYQVNFTLPSAMPGGIQPLVLTIGGVATTRTVTLPVAASAPFILSGQVKNAASNTTLAAAGAGLAQGSYIAIYGTGLGPDTFASGAIPYPATLGGSSVSITPSGGSPIAAYLTFALAGQVNAILPSNVPLGDATVTVSYNGATSPPEKIKVVKSSFGIFSTGFPIGAAAIININTASLYNLLTNAANGGDVMLLFGTGLGPITSGDNVPPGAVTPAGIDVKVLIGGQTITPLYAGRSSQFPALDQINFVLPSDGSIPDGCFVPVAVQVNGVVSNYATLAKATGSRTCPSPLGLSTAALQRLDQGAKINLGLLSLNRSTIQGSLGPLTATIVTEQAGATFAALDAAGLFSLLQTPGAIPPLHAPGTCLVQTVDAFSPPTTSVPAVPKPLNAGAKLTLSGPGNKAQDLPSLAGIGYGAYLAQSGATIAGIPLAGLVPGVPVVPSGLPATYIESGPWSIKGAGGTQVGALSATVSVPAPLVCTNCDGITSIDRSQPLTLNWTGGGGANDYVQIGGAATAASLADPSKNVASLFACTARASDGKFTIPASVLGQLPTSSSDPTAANTGALIIVNGLGTANASFTAPLTTGGNLDAGYFGYSSVLTKLVGYK